VGRAYQPGEFGGFGVDPAESRDRFAESLEILMKCFSGERFSHEGEFWNATDVLLYPKQVQKPNPPIYMVAVSPPSYEIAAD
jgi:alkanesulfonate monooxygenase SsuD/methylene tetrahydromethanopterin reductase-like flavin-dependent oxidoreductase (luciferase family)